MDPVSTTTAILAIAQKLYTFIESARTVSQAVRDLHSEVQNLASVYSAVETTVRDLHNDQRDDEDLQDLVRDQLAECSRSVTDLDRTISGIITEHRNVLQQARRQILLNIKEDEIARMRSHVQANVANLQISLQLINLRATYLGPQLVSDDLGPKITRLEGLIRGMSSRTSSPLLNIAMRYLEAGSTLYQESIAETPAPARAQQRLDSKVERWIRDVTDLEDTAGIRGQMAGVTLDHQKHRHRDSIASAGHDSSHRASVLTPFTITDTTGGTRTSFPPSDSGISMRDRPPLPDDVSEISVASSSSYLDRDLAQKTVEHANDFFESSDFGNAETTFLDAIDQIKELPIEQRSGFDVRDIHFKLATCAFHVADPATAQQALLSVVEQSSLGSTSDKQRIDLLTAGHLLTQTYVRLGDLPLAAATCKNTLKSRRRALGGTHDEYYDSIGLMSTIYELQGNPTRAKAQMDMIPKDKQESIRALFEDLRRECPSSQADPSSDVIIPGPSRVQTSLTIGPTSPVSRTSSHSQAYDQVSIVGSERAGSTDAARQDPQAFTPIVAGLTCLPSEVDLPIGTFPATALDSPITMAWSPDETEIAVEVDGQVVVSRLVDRTTSDPLPKIPGARFNSILNDTTVVYYAHDVLYLVHYQKKPPRIQELSFANSTWSQSLTVVTDKAEKYVACMSDVGAVDVWDRVSGVRRWYFHERTTTRAVDFSADGTLLAIGTKRGVKVWDMRSGALDYDIDLDLATEIGRCGLKFLPDEAVLHLAIAEGIFRIDLDKSLGANNNIRQVLPAGNWIDAAELGLLPDLRIVTRSKLSIGQTAVMMADHKAKLRTTFRSPRGGFHSARLSSQDQFLATILFEKAPPRKFRSPRCIISVRTWDLLARLQASASVDKDIVGL